VSRDNTLDGFLGGRLSIAQPRRGFRAGHDTVLLAASIPAPAGSHVLELGSGAGVASLCLGGGNAVAMVVNANLEAVSVGVVPPQLMVRPDQEGPPQATLRFLEHQAGDVPSVAVSDGLQQYEGIRVEGLDHDPLVATGERVLEVAGGHEPAPPLGPTRDELLRLIA
jgi:hypothetical protein